MSRFNLDSMSSKDLSALAARVSARIAAKRTEEKSEVRNKIDALVKAAGMTVAEVYGAKTARPTSAATGKVAPKYRDPNTGTTWTGRGRQPLWMPKSKAEWGKLAL